MTFSIRLLSCLSTSGSVKSSSLTVDQVDQRPGCRKGDESVHDSRPIPRLSVVPVRYVKVDLSSLFSTRDAFSALVVVVNDVYRLFDTTTEQVSVCASLDIWFLACIY